MAKCTGLAWDVCIEFAPITESETNWRAGISLLLQSLKQVNLICSVKAHWVGVYDQ